MKVKHGSYPSLIDGWKTRHTNKAGKFEDEEARRLFLEMDALQKTQSQSSTTVNEEQIMGEVMGKRRGYNVGRGRVVKPHSSSIDSTAQSHQPIGRVYSQEEVDQMFAAERARTESHIQSQMSAILETLNARGISVSFPETPSTTYSTLQKHNAHSQEDEEEEDNEEEDDEEDDGPGENDE